MRLSDLMGSLELSTYPQIALIIFLCVFAAVCVRLFRSGMKHTCEEARMMPLREDAGETTKDVTP